MRKSIASPYNRNSSLKKSGKRKGSVFARMTDGNKSPLITPKNVLTRNTMKRTTITTNNEDDYIRKL